MGPKSSSEREPRPLQSQILFEEGDFHALSEGLASDPQYNDRRLVTRRKLLTLGKELVPRIEKASGSDGVEGEGLKLECRSSLHNPSSFNGMRVRRLWTYLCRSKQEKRRLRGILGSDLGKDLDAAFRNAYLCLAIEAEHLEVSLRIHPEGWYDGQNLVNRVRAEGLESWRSLLNQLSGFRLRMDDWKGEWSCGTLTPESLEEFLSYYKPGEHRLALERRWPAPEGARGAALESAAVEELSNELLRLVPIYRYTAWSKESDHLFSGS